MAKKMLKKKMQRKPAVQNVAAPVVESAREIWLAGLGAFNVAQQESGRIIEQGSKLFERLVAEGSKVEKKTRKDVEGAVSDIRGEVGSRVAEVKQQAEGVRKQANENWDKLEKIFEGRVAKALSGLGIPSKEEVGSLADKVQKLARQVAELDAAKIAVKPAAKTRTKAVKAKAKAAKPQAKATTVSKPAKAPAAKAVKSKPAVRKVARKKVAKKVVKKVTPSANSPKAAG